MQPNDTLKVGPVDPAKLYQILLILWGAIFMSVVLMFLLAFFLVPEKPKAETDNHVLTIVLTAIGTLAAIASIFIRQKLMATAIEQQQAEVVTRAYIIAFALCESAALFGLLIRFSTNDRYYYLLFIVAVIFLVLNMPRRSDAFNALSGKRI
ncbi:MAG TPA: hypothetical protein VGC64_00585 [Pyrinomonadaceae bacterium]